MDVLTRLQNIDRRVLYVLVAAVIAVPIIMKPSAHPSTIFSEVRSAYRTLDSVPPGKIVILSEVYGPGTSAENDPQFAAIARHLLMKGIKFAVVSWDTAGAELTYRTAKRVQDELGKEYGKDWVHLGFRPPGQMPIIVSGMAENFPKVMNRDRSDTPISKLPALAGVKDFRNIGAVVDVTPSATVGIWIAYFTGPKGVPLIYCPTAVMSAEAYPYLDSGQMKGMLNGVMGAAQYETLVGEQNKRTYAAAASWALSSAHVFIIALIVLGNLGYVLERRAGRIRGGARLG